MMLLAPYSHPTSSLTPPLPLPPLCSFPPRPIRQLRRLPASAPPEIRLGSAPRHSQIPLSATSSSSPSLSALSSASWFASLSASTLSSTSGRRSASYGCHRNLGDTGRGRSFLKCPCQTQKQSARA
ncbi:hypothetical protein BDR03DRAFT_965129 [Suillus americanus]|nr:hypothetical protein BDR03DRAFT_965129 [Suillus americanus]